MEQLRYSVGRQESLTRWRMSDMGREPFASPCESFEAPVNLGEGYVQIVYPVRRAFLEQNQLENMPLYTGEYAHIYFPFETNRVDFTTFIHTPHHVWIHAMTQVEVEEDGKYPFELYTCGGVRLWINGEPVVTYGPYTRNIPGKLEVELPFRKGLNEICVYADELAERDVFFYYELRYMGDKPLTGVLPVEESVEEIIAAENFLKSCYFASDRQVSGDLMLNCDGGLLKKDETLYINYFAEGMPLRMDGAQTAVAKATAHPGQDAVRLGALTDFRSGVSKLCVGMQVGKYMINRDLVVGLLPDRLDAIEPGATLDARKQQALDFVCSHGDGTITHALAHFACGGKLDAACEADIRNSLGKIHRKEDCSDFVFSPMMVMLTRYRDLLPEALLEEIRENVLNFRYWIDEPGNDVMWYFSENHAFLFHIAQYMAGHLFPNDRFAASGRLGTEQKALGRARIEEWFDTFFRYGYAEWNSATYIPVDLIGLFTLHEVAPDEEIRTLARRALDFTFRIMMFNSYRGVMSSSYGRAYEDTLKVRDQVEMSFVEWVAYGSGHINYRTHAVTMFAISSYVPPHYDEDAAVGEGEYRLVELDQGINKIKTYSCMTSDYFMGSVRRYRPFVHGHQQHLMNVSCGAVGAQFFVNHPGERLFSGGNRPSYWAGNGTMPLIEQHGNLLGMIYHIDPAELVHYIHTYTALYEYDETVVEGNWLFLRAGDSYLGAWFSNGFEITRAGANTGKETISRGLDHGVVVKCGSKFEFGSFLAFREAMLKSEPAFDGHVLTMTDPQMGAFVLRDSVEAELGGKPLAYEPAPEMQITRGRLPQA